MARTATIRVLDGGNLKSQPSISLENVPPFDFTQILNMRRQKDQLLRREGWEVFRPDSGQPAAQQYVYDGTEVLQRLAELIRGDGTRILVGASQTKIKYFSTATDAWVTIGTGFSASGEPWQAEAIASVLILNNAVDLPQTYEVGDAAVLPLYEAREGGIASAGRIGEYNGFLFLGDIVEVQGDKLAPWMNGFANHTTTSTSAQVASFNILAANHRVQFNVTTGAANVVATLPAMTLGSVPFFAWIAKVDAGAGTVTTSPVLDGDPLVLDSVNDTSLLFWNGTRWAAIVFPSGTIPAHDPYGLVYSEILEYIPDEQAWSDLGHPKNFAPLLSVVQESSSVSIILPFKPNNWVANQTRVAVVNGGPDGGTLGGQSTSPTGILITAFSAFAPADMGVTATLETATDSGLTYPRKLAVTRWTDVSTPVGKQRLGNGSRITSMMSVNGVQAVAHTRGFFINRYTAQAKRPFALRDKYSGKNVPMTGDCVARIGKDLILYPSVSRGFFSFDGLTDPRQHMLIEDARDFFFSGLTAADRIWAVDNPATNEVWFCRPDRVVAYSYDHDSPGVSVIDAEIGAAAFITKPAGDEDWFVIGIAGSVYVYGLAPGSSTVETWLRDSQLWAARTAAAANSWQAIAWSPTLGLFAAVATSGVGNRVMTSPDGETWTTRASAADNNWTDIAWGEGLFVAVSSNGASPAMTSPDGINWTLRSIPVHAWQSVAYGNGQFVAVGNATTATSPDGITWTDRTNATALLRSVVYGAGAGLFVAVSVIGDCTTSPDGITWTLRTIPAGVYLDVAWSEELDLFVAVGSVISTSPDGVTWTARTLPEANTWEGIAWSPDDLLFVAVSSTGTNRVMTSVDGITWLLQSAAEANSWRDLVWSPSLGMFAAVASDGTSRVMTTDSTHIPTAQLTSGLVTMNDQFHEKTVNSYTPLLSSPSPNVAITVQLRKTHNANAALEDLLDPDALPSPQGLNFIPCFFQGVYWQDEIVLTDTDDVDFRISGRIYEFEGVSGQGGVTRSTV